MSLRSTLMSFRSNSSQKNQKYFPQESPKKPREKMPTIYRHKYNDKPYLYDPAYNNFNQNPELGLEKTQPLRRTNLDYHVQIEKSQMVINTGRSSFDNPDWIKTTFNHYKKSNFSPPRKSDLMQQRNYDVVSNMRKSKYSFSTPRNEDTYYRNMIRDQMQTSANLRNLNGSLMDSRMRSTLSWIENFKKQVSPKVGALGTRDFSIRKPLLKIGKNQYINTYSPFEKF